MKPILQKFIDVLSLTHAYFLLKISMELMILWLTLSTYRNAYKSGS